MLYSKHINVSANTTEANSSKTRFKVNRGMLWNVWLTFPPGCAGLVKIRIWHEGHPFLPVHAVDYINGDNITFQFPIYQEIVEEPEQMTIEVWNIDDTYDHTLQVLMLVLPKNYILPIGATEGIMESLSNLIIRKEGKS